jgi:hypothetical protein
MMTARDCFRRVLTYRPADYVPNLEFGPMLCVLADWRTQGMPRDADFHEYFGLHRVEGFIHIDYGPIPGVPDRTPWPGVASEDGRSTFMRDAWGREVEHLHADGMAEGSRHVLRPGITGRTDWERIRHHFGADEPRRYPDHWDEDPWSEKVARWRGRDHILELRAPSMVGELKEIMGFEGFCVMLYEDRALVEEIMETRTQLALDILGRAFQEVDFDVFHFWEDIAFNSGPIMSPVLFSELAVPRYRRLCEFFRSCGGEIVSVDSDGDVRELIPLWVEAGVNHIWPLEVNAGMDVVALRGEYGRDVTWRGGINKFALREGREAIDRELDRIAPVVQDGGYIPQLDHQTPNGVTFESFCYYMERKKELLGVRT